MQSKLENIINNSLIIDKNFLFGHTKKIVDDIQIVIEKNKDLLISANQVDEKNHNGFLIDFDILKNIFSSINQEKLYFGDVILSQKDDEKKFYYGKEILDKGIVAIISDGNPYVIIELALRNILVGNTIIFANTGYMLGTNQLIIETIQTVLEKYSVSKNLIQLYTSEDYTEILSSFANLDLVIGVGDSLLQKEVLNKSKNKTIVSGYENFELYIENDTHKELIEKILKSKLNIQLYINQNIHSEYDGMIVMDVNEAIAQINYNKNGYSAAIFTDSVDNSSKFIKEVKTKIVTVNTSPSIERLLDIKQSDLYLEKTIIYPINHEFQQKNEP